MRSYLTALISAMALVLALFLAQSALAERRVALVMAAEAYRHPP
jgi:hypothetical protein